MPTAAELKILSNERIKEANLLFAQQCYDGAYYLSGYAIEMALKAAICRRLNVEAYDSRVKLSANISKAFLTHNYSDLILLSGLRKEFESLISADHEYLTVWSVVDNWSEKRRYNCGCKPETAKRFIKNVTEFHIWIQHHW